MSLTEERKVFEYIDSHGKIMTEDELFFLQNEITKKPEKLQETLNGLVLKGMLKKVLFDLETNTTRQTYQNGHEVNAYIVNMPKHSIEQYFI